MPYARLQKCLHIQQSKGEPCKKYDLVIDSVPDATRTSEVDHKQQHTEVRLSFGFFLSNKQDAEEEGDGERLLKLYTVPLLFYKAYGHVQIAYSTLLLTLQVNATPPFGWHTVLPGTSFKMGRDRIYVLTYTETTSTTSRSCF